MRKIFGLKTVICVKFLKNSEISGVYGGENGGSAVFGLKRGVENAQFFAFFRFFVPFFAKRVIFCTGFVPLLRPHSAYPESKLCFKSGLDKEVFQLKQGQCYFNHRLHRLKTTKKLSADFTDYSDLKGESKNH